MKLLFALLLLASSALGQTAQPTAGCCPDATDQKRQLLFDKLKQTVEEEDRHLNGVLGVAILDLTSGQQILVHPDDVFPQASSIKIAVLAELYRQVEQGKVKLTDLYTVQQADNVPDSWIFNGLTPGVTRLTLRDLATMMIAVSDNSATNVLTDRLGMDNVNQLLASLGLKNTRLRRKMMDIAAAREGRENISTPREMMTLLAALHQGKVLNQELTAQFFAMLATPKESPIRHAVPEAVQSADKPGELEAVRADSGVVLVPNRPFVIAVMTTYLKDEDAGNAAIRRIAAAAYDYFDRLGRSSSLGRVVSPYTAAHP